MARDYFSRVQAIDRDKRRVAMAVDKAMQGASPEIKMNIVQRILGAPFRSYERSRIRRRRRRRRNATATR